MRTLRRNLMPLLLLLGLLAALIYAFQPTSIDVDVARATRGMLRVTIDQEGRTRIRERYVVAWSPAGRMMRLEVRAGDTVEAGKTVLTRIEPSHPELLDARPYAEAEACLKTADANLLRPQATLSREQERLDIAMREHDRAERLFSKQAIAQEEFERSKHLAELAREQRRVAEFELQVATFEREQARAALMFTQPALNGAAPAPQFSVCAPIHGKVLRVLQESATVVTPGTRLVELGDPTDLECEIDVLSTDAVRIPPGALVLLEHWGGEKPLSARVRVVEPAAFTKISALGVEEQRVWVIADFTDPAEERRQLGDGYRVEARIVVWEGRDVLKVPSGALFRQGDTWAVFVVKDRKALRPTVQVGKTNGRETEIVGGLAENEVVILHPSDRVAHGILIALRGP